MMSRKIQQDAPVFARVPGSNVHLSYDIELITPMAGGGVESWVPDRDNPARTQAIKGQLRFWWRTFQPVTSPAELKVRENSIWGYTDQASTVSLTLESASNRELLRIERTGGRSGDVIEFDNYDLPGYVLFPLQGQKDSHGHLIDSFDLISKLHITLTIQCRPENQVEIEKTVALWVLFGGLGARTTRGCGSLYCPQVMDSFGSCEDIHRFIRDLTHEGDPAFGNAPFPVFSNCRFSHRVNTNQDNPATEWNSYLSAYGNFRQGPGVGRNPGYGRTRWPEADAVRRLDGHYSPRHTPAHPAGNWFPRGAYGLPVKTEFKSEPPDGDFLLQPAGKGRWPSPVILKVIKLGEHTTARVCLILNHSIPSDLVINRDGAHLHTLLPDEHPLASTGKTMPANATIMHTGTPGCTAKDPYDALISYLNLTEVP